MTGNPWPWLILLAIVVVVLVIKGYVPFPALAKKAAATAKVAVSPWVAPMTSEELGLMYAKAIRAEAEHEIASKFAKEAGASLKASFTAPFSPPAPAGQDQAPPADTPPPA